MTTTEFLDYLAGSATTRELAAQMARLVAERRRLDAYVAFARTADAPTPTSHAA